MNSMCSVSYWWWNNRTHETVALPCSHGRDKVGDRSHDYYLWNLMPIDGFWICTVDIRNKRGLKEFLQSLYWLPHWTNWIGVLDIPCLTLAGDSFAARWGASICVCGQ